MDNGTVCYSYAPYDEVSVLFYDKADTGMLSSIFINAYIKDGNISDDALRFFAFGVETCIRAMEPDKGSEVSQKINISDISKPNVTIATGDNGNFTYIVEEQMLSFMVMPA